MKHNLIGVEKTLVDFVHRWNIPRLEETIEGLRGVPEHYMKIIKIRKAIKDDNMSNFDHAITFNQINPEEYRNQLTSMNYGNFILRKSCK